MMLALDVAMGIISEPERATNTLTGSNHVAVEERNMAAPIQESVDEIWKPVPGYDGRYFVSSAGRVWSVLEDRALRGHINNRGYRQYCLKREGKWSSIYGHTLVATVFHGEAPPLTECRHLNGNRSDNRATNLCWGTAKENAADREDHGNTLRGEAHGRTVIPDAEAVALAERYAAGGVTQRALASELGVSQCAVQRAIKQGTAAIRAIHAALCGESND